MQLMTYHTVGGLGLNLDLDVGGVVLGEKVLGGLVEVSKSGGLHLLWMELVEK